MKLPGFWFLVLTCLMIFAKSMAQEEPRVVCYYTNWSIYRPGNATYSARNINPDLCTHLIYAFGDITNDNKLQPSDKYQDIQNGGYIKFNGLKISNKNLKTLLAIGGWKEGSSRFSPLVGDADKRQSFIKNTVKYLRRNKFDGLNLDWQYPTFRAGGNLADRANFPKFVQELREKFDQESSKTGKSRLLLTIGIPPGIDKIEQGYDVVKLNQYLDWFNVLTYDYHDSFEPETNHHAPLYSPKEDDELSVDFSLKYLIDAGADRQKLVLGIPAYGRSFKLFKPDATGIGAPADGPGNAGDTTEEKGFMAYYEICQYIKSDDKWTVVHPNDNVMGPYLYKDDQWISYDDENIARKKGQYAAKNGLGGIVFWAIDTDDFNGSCSGKQYPLIEAAKEGLYNALGNKSTDSKKIIANLSPQTIKLPTQQLIVKYDDSTNLTPGRPIAPIRGSDLICEGKGFFSHPRDCKKYFWCSAKQATVTRQFTCPSDLLFNKQVDSCDHAHNVICKTQT